LQHGSGLAFALDGSNERVMVAAAARPLPLTEPAAVSDPLIDPFSLIREDDHGECTQNETIENLVPLGQSRP
jgi:hypothetical protein